MGFYGNITNTNRTQFQFDKTFPNRKVMDDFTKTDGVYIGRYVLVEYDNQLAADWCTVAYQKTIDGVKCFFSAPMAADGTPQVDTKYLFNVGNIITGKYIRVPGYIIDTDGKTIVYNLDTPGEASDIIYYINGELDSNHNINVSLISELPKSPYNENYNIDIKAYGPGRGYDSTVWQKVYADGNEKYVMIAELNSVVPTFGISADAPTLSPVAPHFDADSTNIYYKVHWQPNWGFRIKSASPNISVAPINDKGETVDGNEIIISKKAENKFPSDEKTVWTRASYDYSNGKMNKYYYSPAINPDTLDTSGKWVKSDEAPENAKMPAAIYYNKAGFNPAIISYSDKDITDKIALEATGLSGYKYNKHDGTGGTEPQVDTQELSILLPSIGNSIAQMWDIVYGNEDINGSNKRNLSIDWSQGSIIPDNSGLRLVTRTESGYGYNTEQVSTLAGVINSAHDIMGMIIQEKEGVKANTVDVSGWNEDYIYYLPEEERFYRKYKTYNFDVKPENYKQYQEISMEKWEIPHSKYYLDYVPSNPYNPTTEKNYPNYILEPYSDYQESRQYYSTVTKTGDGILGSSFKGAFEPNKYFVYDTKKINFNSTDYELITHRISLDKTFNPQSGYHIITYKSLGNTRFWVPGEFYTATFTEDNNPSVEKFNENLLFIKDDKNKYHRPNEYIEGKQYYKATNFKTAEGNMDKNAQYFTVSKKTENNITYIEQIKYIIATGVNSTNFNYRTYYIKDENSIYYPATAFDEKETYYIKEVTLVETEGTISVSAKDVIEVNVIDFAFGRGYCQYIPGDSGGANGFDEYIEITQATVRYFTDNLVQITTSTNLEIYEPNLYYYEIEGDGNPLKGSVVFDTSSIPTKDRVYYDIKNISYSGPIDYKGNYRPYQPSKYYYLLDGKYVLDTALEYTVGRQYYEKNALYVMSDTSGLFPIGSEWNANVTDIPDSVTLGIRTEVWKLQELKGFARHYNTIHGLILRLNKVLETDNTLTRDLDSIQGIINKTRDLFVKFDEMYPNEILVTNNLGRITTTGLKGDNWINTEYNNGSKITITHKYIGENSGIGEHIVSGELENKTLDFGGTFTSPSFSFTTDDRGHINKFSTSNKTITMPILEFTDGTSNANVVTNMAMSAGSGSNKITFTETRDYIGNLLLNGYNIGTTEGSITETDSLNKALGLIEYKLGSKTVSSQIDTKINTLDVDSVGGDAYYLSSISEIDGKINAIAKSIETSINSTSVNTAVVSPKAVYDYLANIYEGTNNITTLGSITTGVWNATPITTEYIADSAITTDKINDSAVTTVKIYNGAVTDDKIASGIDASKLTIGILPVDRIADNSITNVKVISLDADKLTGTLSIDRITDGSIIDAKLASGIDASKISGTLSIDNIPDISATKITADTLSVDRIPDLDASKITSGVLSAEIIPELSASKITSDVLAVDRIPNLSGSKILLTDYIISEEVKQPLTIDDSVNSAFAKLEKRIADLEAALGI